MGYKEDLQVRVMQLLGELNSETRHSMRGDLIAMQLHETIDAFKREQQQNLLASHHPSH
ncbi:MAG: hypothetical protein ACFHVJ_07000 [Aestuariibacter sp.]